MYSQISNKLMIETEFNRISTFAGFAAAITRITGLKYK
jgi:hypothetical protein